MAARPQSTCYPQQGLTGQICTVCNANAGHTQPNCTENSNTTACGSCVSCNTVCVSAQSYCSINHQNVTSHQDISSLANICVVKDQIIHTQWTAQWWNSLQDNILTANNLGKAASQNASLTMTPAAPRGSSATYPTNSLITAEKYNQIIRGLNAFSANKSEVVKDDVITAAHSLALQSGFQAMKFNTSVCDICNAGGQTDFNCSCNCSCSCSCNCSCSSAPCSCPDYVAPCGSYNCPGCPLPVDDDDN